MALRGNSRFHNPNHENFSCFENVQTRCRFSQVKTILLQNPTMFCTDVMVAMRHWLTVPSLDKWHFLVAPAKNCLWKAFVQWWFTCGQILREARWKWSRLNCDFQTRAASFFFFFPTARCCKESKQMYSKQRNNLITWGSVQASTITTNGKNKLKVSQAVQQHAHW